MVMTIFSRGKKKKGNEMKNFSLLQEIVFWLSVKEKYNNTKGALSIISCYMVVDVGPFD